MNRFLYVFILFLSCFWVSPFTYATIKSSELSITSPLLRVATLVQGGK